VFLFLKHGQLENVMSAAGEEDWMEGSSINRCKYRRC